MKKQKSPKKEKLLHEYIGKNYDKITTHVFNWAGFFFGPFYLIYKKMIFVGLVAFSLEFLLLIALMNTPILIAEPLNKIWPLPAIIIVYLLSGIIIGFIVNPIYLDFAQNKISQIVENGATKNQEILSRTLRKQGKPNVGLTLLKSMLIIAGVLIGFLVLIFLLGLPYFI